MPFSCVRSVRAPASNATSAVSARVPGSPMLYTGSPFAATVVVEISAIGRSR